MLSGLIGVPLGSILAQRLRSQYPGVDPMICAIGLLISSPLLFGASLCANVNSNACYALIFFGEVFLNLNWSVVADMLLVSTGLARTGPVALAKLHATCLMFVRFSTLSIIQENTTFRKPTLQSPLERPILSRRSGICWESRYSSLLPLQYVVVPTRRSTAEAFQILVSHALGDAGSPYLVGLVSPVP
jgi:hypothetical protein